MIAPSNAHVPGVMTGATASSRCDDVAVPVSDGLRRGVVSWDRRRCTYRAEIDVFDPLPDVEPPSARTVDAVWDWLAEPAPGTLPGRLVVGNRPVELITIDALVNRLAMVGFHPDRPSLRALFNLRSVVRERCGSVVFLGHLRPTAPRSSPSVPAAEILLGLPGREPLPLRRLLELHDHGFGWGRRGPAAVRTAAVLVDLAWSQQRDAATEAAVVDLALSVLAELRGGFVWRAESVADWIATETGELADQFSHRTKGAEPSEPVGFRQLALELR